MTRLRARRLLGALFIVAGLNHFLQPRFYFHKGSGIPIGTTLRTRGVLVPQAVGTDVNCGMRVHLAGWTNAQGDYWANTDAGNFCHYHAEINLSCYRDGDGNLVFGQPPVSGSGDGPYVWELPMSFCFSGGPGSGTNFNHTLRVTLNF